MPIDGDKKGKRYMRLMCRTLSAWAAGTDPGDPMELLAFQPLSTWVAPMVGWSRKGDLYCRDGVDWPFSVECKSNEQGSLDNVLEAPAWSVWGWWGQACVQARANQLAPLLLFKRNYRQTYAMLETDLARQIDVRPRHAVPVLRLERPSGEEVTICLLDDLVEVPLLRPGAIGSQPPLSNRRSRKSVG